MLSFIFFLCWNKTVHFHLNTSHVIFYRVSEKTVRNKIKFKYISCYLLSRFINNFNKGFKNLNTSHVIFYPAIALKYGYNKKNLNTSHVIFYPTILSHFSIIILRKSLYFSRFLLYFTTLRQFFQIYFETTCFPLYLLGFLDFSVFLPGKITGLMFLHCPLHRFLKLLHQTRCHSSIL